MKIVRAMKETSRLKGEIKEIKKRLSSCLNTAEENEFDEDFESLNEILSTKIKKLINLKTRIIAANVKHGMFQIILNLGELKSYIEFLKELEPKKGIQESSFSLREENIKFKSQMDISDKNKKIESYQATINGLTDRLDDFNAKTDIEENDIINSSLSFF